MVIDIPGAEVEDGVIVRQPVYIDDLDGFGMLNHTRYPVRFDHAVWTSGIPGAGNPIRPKPSRSFAS